MKNCILRETIRDASYEHFSPILGLSHLGFLDPIKLFTTVTAHRFLSMKKSNRKYEGGWVMMKMAFRIKVRKHFCKSRKKTQKSRTAVQKYRKLSVKSSPHKHLIFDIQVGSCCGCLWSTLRNGNQLIW